MEAKELTKLAVKALEDKKGEDIRVIDIHGVSVLADYFVIADGSNASQVKAMADNVEEELGKAGHECRQIEGYQTAGWILMDYGDLIVHIFSRDDRLFYDLERIWRKCVRSDRRPHLSACLRQVSLFFFLFLSVCF